MYCKAIFFLTTDTTPESDNSFSKNLMAETQRVIVTIDQKLKMETCRTKLMEQQQKYLHYHQAR